VTGIRIPAQRPEDWRRLLADPVKHWRLGYSAYELAHAWQSADGFPPAVAAALADAPFGRLELVFAFPEHKVAVPGRGGHSATDLFTLGRSATGQLVAIAVEGKVSESFDVSVREWLADPKGNRDNRQTRIDGLVDLLQMGRSDVDEVPYQLLHRSASALIEAKRYHAPHALMLVHSFSPDQDHLDAYQRFAQLFNVAGEPGVVESGGAPHGTELHLCWISDQLRSHAHEGQPEGVFLEALDWLRETYSEHRFFKERDVEAVLQQRMSELFEERRSQWCVVENYKQIDLAVVDRESPNSIPVGAEIKYEPDHSRPGEEARRQTGKYPVTEWPLFVRDHDKLHTRVSEGLVQVGYALLFDEAGYFRRSKTPPPFGEWQIWGEDDQRKMAPAVLLDRID
jgi:hypothetical protein